MIQTEIAIQVNEEAATFYTFFIERANELFAENPLLKELKFEDKDVPTDILEFVAKEKMQSLKYDKSESRIAVHCLSILENGKYLWLSFYSKKVEAPPPSNFRVRVDGQIFEFNY